MSKEFVVEHGTPGTIGKLEVTNWQDSELPFTLQAVAGENFRYIMAAEAQCTICDARFTYQEARRPSIDLMSALGTIAIIAMLIICANVGLVLSGVLLLIASVSALIIVALVAKPREPDFQQIGGPTQAKHRVRPLS
jgi:hypothetical protein